MSRRLRTILSGKLPSEIIEQMYNSYDVVGDIAIIRLDEKSERFSNIVAEVIMNSHKNVKTILAQTGGVHGEFRLRKLNHIAGENRTTTIHRESACTFHVDVESCYFSPRLLYERKRIGGQVKAGEVVVNMFAGVGCFSILIAKHSAADKVFSIDINPAALQYMCENIRVNGAYGRVVPMLGDAKDIIQKSLHRVADRVLMPLPEKALEYLPYAILALKPSGGMIHYYDFEYADKKEEAVEKVKLKVAERLESLGVVFGICFSRVVRSTGPHWYQVVLDIKISDSNLTLINSP